MESYEAVIVGGGPAGSTTAYRLATAGVKTLVLDRAHFPREKPCGGGVTLRGAKQLPFSIDPVVETTASAIDFRLQYGAESRHAYDAPIVLMTRRSRLDAYLLEKAAEAGAEVRQGARVRELRPDLSRPEAIGDGFRVKADVILGADGANGVCAAAIGSARSQWDALAYEGNADRALYSSPRYENSMLFEVGTVPGGYAWIFPKGDHTNFGVGGWFREGPQMKAHLARLCGSHGVDVDRLSGVRGYRIPLRGPDTQVFLGRFALIGDAAGLADPLSGDGMYEAFTSGRLASENALRILGGHDRDFSRYRAALRAELGRHSAISWLAKLILERRPRAGYRIATSKIAGRLFYGDVSGTRSVRLPLPAPAAGSLQRLAQTRLLPA